MNLGADGIFIDAIPQTKILDPCLVMCYGEEQQTPDQYKHTHIFSYSLSDNDAKASGAQQKAFEILLKKVRKVVKFHKGVVLGNTGVPMDSSTQDGEHFNWTNPDQFVQKHVLPYIDADILEQFLDFSMGSWDGFWHTRIKAVQEASNGKAILAISPNPRRESVLRGCHFLTYATARLAGFVSLSMFYFNTKTLIAFFSEL